VRTAVDTNVISVLWSSEPLASHEAAKLDQAHAQGGLVICAPVYAELLAHPSARQSFVDDFLSDTNIVVDFALDEPIWRQAAQSFAAYAQRRRRSGGGSPKRLLVDFVIAAHAMLHADRLMTLDASRYQRDFPKLRIF
jgi:predicted nucleic acid-binding protein